jgi:hypothetical protein
VSESYLSLCSKHVRSGTYDTSPAIPRSLRSPDLASLVFSDDHNIDKYSTVKGWGGPSRSTPSEREVVLETNADTNSVLALPLGDPIPCIHATFIMIVGGAFITLLNILFVGV